MQDPGSAETSDRTKANSSALLATVTMLQDGSDLVSDNSEHGEIAPFAPGYLLSERWKIVDRIGKGGFGFVYSAQDLELDAMVAVKVLRPEHETSAATIQQFKQEIQLARQVTHKNVCRIYDVGFYSQGDLRIPFLTMELLEGQPLDERLREEGPLSMEEVEVIALQVVDALEAAHLAGIVHADLKPANIMLVGRGADTRAVVADFGLASAHVSAARKNKEAKVVGTPAYMAPEQVEGQKLGPAADFYALGCTLFQIISGQLPFHADTPVTTARARLTGPPPSLGKASRAIPARWIALVRDLMAVDAESRLVSRVEIRRRLRKQKRTALWIGAALMMALWAGLLFFALSADEVPESTAPESPFMLSLPSAVETRAVYDQGLAHWEQFRLVDAVETWQKAVDDGHRHPRLLVRLCAALRNQNRFDAFHECTRAVFAASRNLSEEEKTYYEAYYWQYEGDSVKAAETLYGLNERHPGNFEIGRLRADIQRSRRKYDDAVATLEHVLEATEDRHRKVIIQATQCNVLVEHKKFAEAITLANSTLPTAVSLKMERERLQLLDSLAMATRNRGRLADAQAYGEEGLRLSQELGSLRFQAKATSILVAVSMQRRHYRRAMELVELRKQHLLANQDKVAANQMNVTRAEILGATGHPQEAIDLLTNLTLPHMRGDKNTYWEAYARLVRSQLRRSMGIIDLALDDCYGGMGSFRSIHRDRLEAFAQVICSEILIETGEFDKARALLKKARDTRSKFELNLLLLQNSLLEAELLLAEGKPEEAYQAGAKVATEFQTLELPHKEVLAREFMARSAAAMRSRELAEPPMAQALAIGVAEDVELALQLRHTALQVRALRESKAELSAELKALQAEATQYGYVGQAQRIAKTRESL